MFSHIARKIIGFITFHLFGFKLEKVYIPGGEERILSIVFRDSQYRISLLLSRECSLELCHGKKKIYSFSHEKDERGPLLKISTPYHEFYQIEGTDINGKYLSTSIVPSMALNPIMQSLIENKTYFVQGGKEGGNNFSKN
jgi:hypothetical protein